MPISEIPKLYWMPQETPSALIYLPNPDPYDRSNPQHPFIGHYQELRVRIHKKPNLWSSETWQNYLELQYKLQSGNLTSQEYELWLTDIDYQLSTHLAIISQQQKPFHLDKSGYFNLLKQEVHNDLVRRKQMLSLISYLHFRASEFPESFPLQIHPLDDDLLKYRRCVQDFNNLLVMVTESFTLPENFTADFQSYYRYYHPSLEEFLNL